MKLLLLYVKKKIVKHVKDSVLKYWLFFSCLCNTAVGNTESKTAQISFQHFQLLQGNNVTQRLHYC